MKKFEKQFSETWFPQLEVGTGELITVPDESLTIRQILDRYTRGLPTGLKDRPQVFGSDVGANDFDDFLPNDYDLSDIDDNFDRVNQAKSNYEDMNRFFAAGRAQQKTSTSETLSNERTPSGNSVAS